MANGPRLTLSLVLYHLYSSLKGEGVDVFEHNERFWYFLKNKGITAHRSAIVRAVAEKTAILFPDLYDPDAYDDEEDEE